jgi:hypothetical protein
LFVNHDVIASFELIAVKIAADGDVIAGADSCAGHIPRSSAEIVTGIQRMEGHVSLNSAVVTDLQRAVALDVASHVQVVSDLEAVEDDARIGLNVDRRPGLEAVIENFSIGRNPEALCAAARYRIAGVHFLTVDPDAAVALDHRKACGEPTGHHGRTTPRPGHGDIPETAAAEAGAYAIEQRIKQGADYNSNKHPELERGTNITLGHWRNE